MRQPTNSFIVFVSSVCCVCFIADASGAAVPLPQETTFVGHSYSDEIHSLREALSGPEASLAFPEHSPAGFKEKEQQANEVKHFIFTEEKINRLIHLSSQNHSGFKRGRQTSLVGLVASLAFLLIHFLAQHIDGKTIDEELIFRRGTGRLTFTGVGLVLGLTALGVGIGEMILAVSSTGGGTKFDWPLFNKVLLETGRHVSGAAGTAIVIGWLLGFPLVLMELAGSTFLAGLGLSLVGLVYMARDGRKAFRLAKRLYVPGDKTAGIRASSAGAQDVINTVILEFLKQHIETQEVMQDGSALANALAEMQSMSAAAGTGEDEEESEEDAENEESATEAEVSVTEEEPGKDLPAEGEGEGDANAEN